MYRKEIIYMGLYKEESRIGSAGFLKVENREREGRLYLKIQNIPLGISGRFPIRVYDGGGWKEIDGITVREGRGSWEESLAKPADKVILKVILPSGYYLEGRSRAASEENVQGKLETEGGNSALREAGPIDVQSAPDEVSPANEGKTANETEHLREPDKRETILIKEELPSHMPKTGMNIAQNVPQYNLKEDKWEQILDTYENIHPYGDERTYVKLEPKDFVILQSKYQHLVNNSFLLHGFYNYRYVILGKEQDYYLGVPGVFYEREKMVALMFGFEAFECPGGNVRAGEFGYYLRKVEL